MKTRLSLLALLTVGFALRGFAADEPVASPSPSPTPTPLPEEATNMRGALHAQLEEDAKKTPAPRTMPSLLQQPRKNSPTLSPNAQPVASAPSPTPAGATGPKDAPTPKPKDENVTMMPKVEVRKERITELDRQVHAKDKEIDDEMKKTKATETDKTLNPEKAPGFLSIFGGRTSAVGEGLANQRVTLLEVERELVEEIALAKTKEEKADLQKQLDEIKAMRRDLEKPR